MALIANQVTGGTIAASWANSIRDTTVQITTSSARPSSPSEGQVIYETDTDLLLAYNGSAWVQIGNAATTNVLGASTAWTATLWENANVAATIDRAVYTRIGSTVSGWCHITSSATGTANSGGIQVRFSGLPAPAYTTKSLTVGTARYQINSGNYYVLEVSMTSSAFIFKRDGYSFTFGSNSNGAGGNTAIASGDIISLGFTYEAA
jgi:hypothetical protein